MAPLSQVIGPCGPAASFLLYFKRQHTRLAFFRFQRQLFSIGFHTDALPPLCLHESGLQRIQCKQNEDGVLNHVIADCDL
jgi:hypothetical protein